MPLNIPAAISLNRTSHRLATLWRITRKDGVVHRFTDHDRDIDLGVERFHPAGGIDASARSRVRGFDPNDIETVGPISGNDITPSDIKTGRLRGAVIEELQIDWKSPWLGAIDSACYEISSITWTGERWVGKVFGLTRFLAPNIGDVYNRGCNQDLGEGICGLGVNLEDFTLFNVRVDNTPVVNRRAFQANANDILVGNGDGYYIQGRVIWVSGENLGVVSDVMDYVDSNRLITLSLPTPNDILEDDVFQISAGCDRTVSTCKTKFNNFVNFKGYPFIPGSDKKVSV